MVKTEITTIVHLVNFWYLPQWFVQLKVSSLDFLRLWQITIREEVAPKNAGYCKEEPVNQLRKSATKYGHISPGKI